MSDGDQILSRTEVLKLLSEKAREGSTRAGHERLTPHECRHTFASLMIAAGVNAKALATFMGHSSITVTLDLYGHLMPGSEGEAAGLLDGYLKAQEERAAEQARAAEPVRAGASSGAEIEQTA